MIDYSRVLIEKYHKTSWKMQDCFQYETLEWYEKEIPRPSKNELDTYWNTVIVEKLKLEEIYKKRLSEYPPISEQLDMIYHHGIEFWKQEILKVKEKYPKP